MSSGSGSPAPWSWRTFRLSVAVALLALVFVTWSTLRLEGRAEELRVQAHRAQLLREALWRIDSAVAPLLIEESARPVYHYFPYFDAPATAPEDGSVAPEPLPSPLAGSPEIFKLHFQVRPGGSPTSPQAPADPERTKELLAELETSVDFARLDRELAARERRPAEGAERGFGPLRQEPLRAHLFRNARGGQVELLFARRVAIGEEEGLQGFWMEWRKLRGRLLLLVEHLLPRAELIASLDATGSEPGGAGDPGEAAPGAPLATLPVRLVPHEWAPAPGAGRRTIPAALAVVWLAGLGAIGAAYAGLRTAHDLSERRARFVSAVTHELRTPLTTFCMYSEMLADGMVPDEAARDEYLTTLKHESTRLRKIVDNVLLFARLERGRGAPETGAIEVGELLDRALPDLARRAEEAGFELVVEDSPATGGVRVAADAEAVGRVLFNLVDNACKYAAGATDRRIVVGADLLGDRVAISVRDFGPGVAPVRGGDVFEPFQRGRDQETGGPPGIGLGLSLSRGVARAMGGDLELASPPRSEAGGARGACFRLTLRVARAGRARTA